MRIVIGLVSVLGTVLFGALFAVSFASPAKVEGWLQQLVRQQVEQRVGEKLAELEQNPAVRFATELLKQTNDEAAYVRELQKKLQPLIDDVLREMNDPHSESRKTVSSWVDDGFKLRLADLSSQGRRVTDFIRGKYHEAAAALLREFRIFTGANALMFLLLGSTLLLRRPTRTLVLPAAALLGTTLIAASLYLLRQDWLHSIVFGDYVGLAYFGYLGITGLLLGDVLLNRGRICLAIVDFLLGIVGSAASS
jgi:hypothetical protein